MGHDTLTDIEVTNVDGEGEADPITMRPPRRFDPAEIELLISKIVLASTARCPDDETWLETKLAHDRLRIRCPTCGACAEWYADAP